MRKIYLIENVQHDVKSYVGVAPARDIVRLATTEELRDKNEKIQRLISPSRLKDIAKFVVNNGLLAGAITIGTRDHDRLSVYKVENSDIPGLFYTDFPETEDEFEKYKGSFDIMDGQHRLFSFLKDYILLEENVKYDIAFNMYIEPTLKDKRIIFKNTNQEQKPVPSNLLLWFRKQLDMLFKEEECYHPIVEMLNDESSSPLRDRIIMADEKITGGYKAEQLIKIFNKINLQGILGENGDTEQYFKIVSTYIKGWEMAVKRKVSIKDNDYAPFSKIAGLRFMLIMLPAMYEKSYTDREHFTKEFICETLKKLFALDALEPDQIFSSEYIKTQDINPFAAETPTTELAEYWISKLKNLDKKAFDPMAY